MRREPNLDLRAHPINGSTLNLVTFSFAVGSCRCFVHCTRPTGEDPDGYRLSWKPARPERFTLEEAVAYDIGRTVALAEAARELGCVYQVLPS